MKSRILIVGRDKAEADYLKKLLAGEFPGKGEITATGDVKKGMGLARQPEIIVLAAGSDPSPIEKIREATGALLAVIVSERSDIVEGLNKGADYCLTEVSNGGLLAVVKALLRRR